eukprot:5372154-Prorocentrum_lima.AAC.1
MLCPKSLVSASRISAFAIAVSSVNVRPRIGAIEGALNHWPCLLLAETRNRLACNTCPTEKKLDARQHK